MANHTKLLVWHRANALSLAVHRAVPARPWRGAPQLKSQLLRAAASIPANIGEGAGQHTNTHFAHFVTIAIGSANELESHLRLAVGLALLPSASAFAVLEEVDQIRRMLLGLRKRLTGEA